MYRLYGNTQVLVPKPTADGLSQGLTQPVLTVPDVGFDAIEGNSFYQINRIYYILDGDPSGATYIWKSASPAAYSYRHYSFGALALGGQAADHPA
ncbi:hypothetical protein GGS24DRAFT_481585 [Hypoxylon argillaceum]|nr:hypothetical protein GGS24DRAFT_481585 [Hypoxylon argillaceum]